MKTILCIIPKGAGDLHEVRARRLLQGHASHATFYNVDRTRSYPSAMKDLWSVLQSQMWDLVYMEGSGIIGGANLIRAAIQRKQPFIVSSGDPIGGFFHVTKGPIVGWCFGQYERLLYRTSAGFVGWTPYLTGAALHMGAPRAVTVEGAVDLEKFRSYTPAERLAARKRFGLGLTDLVCGVVGSLRWTPRQNYCYGLELVETLKRVRRTDISILIVGDGDGRKVMEQRLNSDLKHRVVFTGRLPESEVVEALNAMDIGFITQTLDELGSYRLTTKLPEYLATSLPVAMSPIPGFFDYVDEAGWALPPFHPASPDFHSRCAAWLDTLTWDDVREKSSRTVTIAADRFDYARARRRFHTFIDALMADSPLKPAGLLSSPSADASGEDSASHVRAHLA
ncbi:MAG: glycosyltransferase [Capsulimonadaceae bacterium]